MEALINQQMPRTHAGRCVLFCTAKKFHVVSKMSSTLALISRSFVFVKMNEDGTIGEGDAEWLERLKSDDMNTYNKMVAISQKCSEHRKFKQTV